jgi:hypothetical protein
MITRGFVQETIVTRGYGITIPGIKKEVLRIVSGICRAITLWSKIWN